MSRRHWYHEIDQSPTKRSDCEGILCKKKLRILSVIYVSLNLSFSLTALTAGITGAQKNLFRTTKNLSSDQLSGVISQLNIRPLLKNTWGLEPQENSLQSEIVYYSIAHLEVVTGYSLVKFLVVLNKLFWHLLFFRHVIFESTTLHNTHSSVQGAAGSFDLDWFGLIKLTKMMMPSESWTNDNISLTKIFPQTSPTQNNALRGWRKFTFSRSNRFSQHLCYPIVR